MRVVINQKHISLNERLAKEANKLAKAFSAKAYLKVENIDKILLKRDVSVEGKKSILMKKLHDSIVRALSINKKKFKTKAFDSLKKRLYNIRRIITKLRSINYYLETTFLEELKFPKMKIRDKKLKLKQSLAADELEALEYTAYQLIGKVVVLDKRLLQEYKRKEQKVMLKERAEINDIGIIIGKESELLEHLEAKLPPPKAVSAALIKEPMFTHWVARVFSLLSYLERLYYNESMVFSKLKKSKSAKIKIGKKIIQLVKEKSKLLEIMEEKSISMKMLKMNNEFKKELRNFTTTINL